MGGEAPRRHSSPSCSLRSTGLAHSAFPVPAELLLSRTMAEVPVCCIFWVCLGCGELLCQPGPHGLPGRLSCQLVGDIHVAESSLCCAVWSSAVTSFTWARPWLCMSGCLWSVPPEPSLWRCKNTSVVL